MSLVREFFQVINILMGDIRNMGLGCRKLCKKISIMQYIYFSQGPPGGLNRLLRIFTRKMFSLLFLAYQATLPIPSGILVKKEAIYLC